MVGAKKFMQDNRNDLPAETHRSIITDSSNEVKFYWENSRPDAQYRNHFHGGGGK